MGLRAKPLKFLSLLLMGNKAKLRTFSETLTGRFLSQDCKVNGYTQERHTPATYRARLQVPFRLFSLHLSSIDSIPPTFHRLLPPLSANFPPPFYRRRKTNLTRRAIFPDYGYSHPTFSTAPSPAFSAFSPRPAPSPSPLSPSLAALVIPLCTPPTPACSRLRSSQKVRALPKTEHLLLLSDIVGAELLLLLRLLLVVCRLGRRRLLLRRRCRFLSEGEGGDVRLL